MEKKKLLIADTSEEFCMAIAERLQKDFEIKTTGDGQEALALLESFAPDVFVMDVMLRRLDGIHVLETASGYGILPKTMVAVSVNSPFVLARLAQLDICYAISKPCSIPIAVARIREIATYCANAAQPHQDLPAVISEILTQLGFRPKHDGYHYLCQAVVGYAAHPGQMLTKQLYDSVAKLNGVSVEQVERGIRFAIESAWKCRNEQLWHRLLTVDSPERPTNGTVIIGLAEHLRQRKIAI